MTTLNRRSLAAILAVGALLPHSAASQELAVPVSSALGRTFIDYLDIGSFEDLTCEQNDYSTECVGALDIFENRLLPTENSESHILRISLEQVGGQSVERIRQRALGLGPNDSISVSVETWTDGSVYELLNSQWLANQFPNNPNYWAGHTPGTWALLVQKKYGKDETARAIVSLPAAESWVEYLEFQTKGSEGRKGFEVWPVVSMDSSLEGRVLAVEKVMYETQAENSDCAFGVAFAIRPGDVVDEGFTVARAAVSVDGNGFLEKAFPIMEDSNGTLQIEVYRDNPDDGTMVALLAK